MILIASMLALIGAFAFRKRAPAGQTGQASKKGAAS